MRRSVMALLTATTGALASGCGGEEKPVAAPPPGTVTVTAPAPAAAPPADPAASGATGAPEATAPDGVAAVEGKYVAKAFRTDYTGFNVVAGVSGGLTFRARFSCAGERCSVELLRTLDSGGTKRYTLKADPDREDAYVGTADSRVECFSETFPARERFAVKVTEKEEGASGPVAGKLDVVYTLTSSCGDEEASRGIVTYKAALDSP